jgi:hypothetical protein
MSRELTSGRRYYTTGGTATIDNQSVDSLARSQIRIDPSLTNAR